MRKRFFIKPALQLRHLAWTVGVVTGSFAVCYFMFESLLRRAVEARVIESVQAAALGVRFQWGFFVAFAVMLTFAAVENVFFFHSLAGPIYALEKAMRRLSEGENTEALRTRHGDQLGELIQAFDDMKRRLQARHASHEAMATFLASEIDRLLASPTIENVDALRSKLKEIREQVEKKAA